MNQNLTATPVDDALRRALRYDVRLDPGLEPAGVEGRVEVTLANAGPTENRTHLSVYSPLGLAGPHPGVTAGPELGRQAYSSTVAVPAGQAATVALDIRGRVELAAGNWYHLDLGHQASLSRDTADVALSVPPGWRIAETRGGLEAVDGRHATATVPLAGDVRLSVRLERTAWSRLWARIRD